MKNKILKLIAYPLDLLFNFRTTYLFVTPKEAQKAFDRYREQEDERTKELRHTLRKSIIDLAHVREKRVRNNYELKITVCRDALETPAGQKLAVADIAMQVSRQLIERHNASLEKDPRFCPNCKQIGLYVDREMAHIKCAKCGHIKSRQEDYAKTKE